MPSDPIGPPDIFTCKKCGDCCKGFGGTYVTQKDILSISHFIGVDEHRFIKEFCQASGRRWVIAMGKNGYCVFWNEICTIHPVKPKMCKAWPFIKPVLIDADNWQIMAGACPGMRTDVEEDVIRSCVHRKLESGYSDDRDI
jgi:uncharacterized protein